MMLYRGLNHPTIRMAEQSKPENETVMGRWQSLTPWPRLFLLNISVHFPKICGLQIDHATVQNDTGMFLLA